MCVLIRETNYGKLQWVYFVVNRKCECIFLVTKKQGTKGFRTSGQNGTGVEFLCFLIKERHGKKLQWVYFVANRKYECIFLIKCNDDIFLKNETTRRKREERENEEEK